MVQVLWEQEIIETEETLVQELQEDGTSEVQNLFNSLGSMDETSLSCSSSEFNTVPREGAWNKYNIIHFQLYDKLVDVERKVESVCEKLNLLTYEKDIKDDNFTMTRYR